MVIAHQQNLVPGLASKPCIARHALKASFFVGKIPAHPNLWWAGGGFRKRRFLYTGYANLFSHHQQDWRLLVVDSNSLIEAAAMLATPTQNPHFIWLIAAVRRDMPTITAKIHHIAAETEREARRTLARDHVCFFAGRIRLEVAA
jgi:hypothetical protein